MEITINSTIPFQEGYSMELLQERIRREGKVLPGNIV